MRRVPTLLILTLAAACAREDIPAPSPDAAGIQDSSTRVAVVTGFSGPEAVRYDSLADVWFVANFNGAPAGDSNGFISRVTADGVVDSLRFMTGSALAALHGPRGMFIQGDTLWAADAAGLHGFHRLTGAHLAFRDLSRLEPGFLNDVAAGPDGALYLTDTGTSHVYRIAGDSVTVALAPDARVGPPNGITLDRESGRFLLAGWEEGGMLHTWDPANGSISAMGISTLGRFDGVEVVGDAVIVASQRDSSLHRIAGGREERIVRTPGQPADIGVDTRHGRVAVPYIALDRVDIWTLPPAP